VFDHLRRLLREVHRRSLWQALGIYLVASWAVLQVVDTLGGALNLPDWFPSFAFAALIVGFPIVLATAIVQESSAEPEAADTEGERPTAAAAALHILSWRNVIMAGVTIFAVWGAVAAVWLLFAGGSPEDSARRADLVPPVTASAALPALAVLPFDTPGGNDEDAFFAEGVHDELRTALSRVSGLTVFSPVSSNAYRERLMPAVAIGAELGATYLLEGRVQRFGDQVRMSLFLTTTSDGSQLWADSYRADLTGRGLFDILSEVAQAVANELGAVISSEELRRIARRSTNSIEAFESYMRGFALTNDHYEPIESRLAEFEAGVRYLEEAVQQDSTFALAYAALAGAYGWFVLRRWDVSPARREAARSAAFKALELAPDLPESHYAMATYLYRVEENYEAALEELRRADVGLRGAGAASLLSAYILRRHGKYDEALVYMERARALDPRSDVPFMQSVRTLLPLGRYEEALEMAERAFALDPSRPINGLDRVRLRYWLGEGPGPVRAYFERGDGVSQTLWEVEFRERNWDASQRALPDDPDFIFTDQSEVVPSAMLRGWTEWAGGNANAADTQFELADQVLRRFREREVDDFRVAAASAQILVGAGRFVEGLADARRAVQMMPLERDYGRGLRVLENLALAAGAAGNAAVAVSALEECCLRPPRRGPPWILLSDPRFDPVRADSQFRALVARYGHRAP